MSANHPGFDRLRDSRRLQREKQQASQRVAQQRRRGWLVLTALAIVDGLLGLSALVCAVLSVVQADAELVYSGPLLAAALLATAWGLWRSSSWSRSAGLSLAPIALFAAAGLWLFGPLSPWGWAGIAMCAAAGLLQLVLAWPATRTALEKGLPPQASPGSAYWQRVRTRH